jgi:5-methylcytosine-specific restriction endonuclease McrA
VARHNKQPASSGQRLLAGVVATIAVLIWLAASGQVWGFLAVVVFGGLVVVYRLSVYLEARNASPTGDRPWRGEDVNLIIDSVPPSRRSDVEQFIFAQAELERGDSRELLDALKSEKSMRFLDLPREGAEHLRDELRRVGAVAYIEGEPNGRTLRQPISKRVRNEVWRRDQAQCVDCGSRGRLEFDHIIPVSKGGSSTARNIELRCEKCNRQKAASI